MSDQAAAEALVAVGRSHHGQDRSNDDESSDDESGQHSRKRLRKASAGDGEGERSSEMGHDRQRQLERRHDRPDSRGSHTWSDEQLGHEGRVFILSLAS